MEKMFVPLHDNPAASVSERRRDVASQSFPKRRFYASILDTQVQVGTTQHVGR